MEKEILAQRKNTLYGAWLRHQGGGKEGGQSRRGLSMADNGKSVNDTRIVVPNTQQTVGLAGDLLAMVDKNSQSTGVTEKTTTIDVGDSCGLMDALKDDRELNAVMRGVEGFGRMCPVSAHSPEMLVDPSNGGDGKVLDVEDN